MDCRPQSFVEVFGVHANPAGVVDDLGGSWKTSSAIARGFVLTRRRGFGLQKAV